MLVTRETDYAVRTILYLAKERNRTSSVTEVAKAMHIPKSFLAKILQRLVKSNILNINTRCEGGISISPKSI